MSIGFADGTDGGIGPGAVRPSAVHISGLTKVYGEGESAVHALRGVDLDVPHGDYVAVMGASGSGKSTMMNIIGCLDVPTGGYRLDGIEINSLDEAQLSVVRNRKIGIRKALGAPKSAILGQFLIEALRHE